MMSVGPVYTAFFEEGLAGFAFGSASMASRAFSPLAAAGSVVLFQTSGAAGVVAGAGVVVNRTAEPGWRWTAGPEFPSAGPHKPGTTRKQRLAGSGSCASERTHY